MEQQQLDNYEKLAEKMYRKGFGEKHYDELKQHIADGTPEFSIISDAAIDKDQMDYRSNFRKDEGTGIVYYNTIDAVFTGEINGEKVIREHSFKADQLITATEMHRMLKYGDLVAVNKNLFNKEGKQYNTWIVLDNKGTKDEFGNYPMNTYHENYFVKKLGEPFVIKEKLKDLAVPVKDLANAKYLDILEKSLQKANLIKCAIFHNEKEAIGYLSANPRTGQIDVLDANMKLIERQQHSQQQAQDSPQQATTPAQTQGDVKKKPWDNQKVNWKKEPSKGKSL